MVQLIIRLDDFWLLNTHFYTVRTTSFSAIIWCYGCWTCCCYCCSLTPQKWLLDIPPSIQFIEMISIIQQRKCAQSHTRTPSLFKTVTTTNSQTFFDFVFFTFGFVVVSGMAATVWLGHQFILLEKSIFV